MGQLGDSFDLGSLHLRSGAGRAVKLDVRVDPLTLGGQAYAVEKGRIPVRIDCSRTTTGWALRLRCEAVLDGPCMRCLESAHPSISVDTREIDQPGADEELHTPYVDGELLDLRGWTHDALLLAAPARLLCKADCRGLCAVCGANLNDVDPAEHGHEGGGDPRWAKLKAIRLQ